MDINEILLWVVRLIGLVALGMYALLMLSTSNDTTFKKSMIFGSIAGILLVATLFIKV